MRVALASRGMASFWGCGITSAPGGREPAELSALMGVYGLEREALSSFPHG